MSYLDNRLSALELDDYESYKDFEENEWKEDFPGDNWSPQKRWIEGYLCVEEKRLWFGNTYSKYITGKHLRKLMIPNCNIRYANHFEWDDGGHNGDIPSITEIIAYELDPNIFRICQSTLESGQAYLEKKAGKELKISLQQGDIFDYGLRGGDQQEIHIFDLDIEIPLLSLNDMKRRERLRYLYFNTRLGRAAWLIERAAPKKHESCFITRFTFPSRPGLERINKNLEFLELILFPRFYVRDHLAWYYQGNNGKGGPLGQTMNRISILWQRVR